MKRNAGRYHHFKGNEYPVTGVARHSETEKELVVYRQEYGDRSLWVRPLAIFVESVEFVETLLTHAMHDLLFAFQESHDCESGIEITVNDEPVAAMSDGMHGEIFGEDGWIVRFSKYPAEAEVERSRRAKEDIERIIRKQDERPEE